MLQLQTKDLDISRISKLLIKYKIKASITSQVITLDGDISDELLRKLCSEISFDTIQNYIEQSKSKDHIETKPIQKPEPKNDENHDTNILVSEINPYGMIFPEVRYGEMYWCDFGEPYGSSMGFKRPAIIIKNDMFETKKSKCTLVVPCSSREAKVSTDYNITFDETNVIDFDIKRFGKKGTSGKIMCGDIKTVDKLQLRQYIGTLKPEVMDEIKPIFSNVLGIVDSFQNQDQKSDLRNMSLMQIKLLTLIDINKLVHILESTDNQDIRINLILDLFGFDFSKKGFRYLIDVIKSSLNEEQYNLSTLCEKVSNEVGIQKEEIMRLVVARVKEQFSSISKKAPTIDFIRLMKSFLV